MSGKDVLSGFLMVFGIPPEMVGIKPEDPAAKARRIARRRAQTAWSNTYDDAKMTTSEDTRNVVPWIRGYMQLPLERLRRFKGGRWVHWYGVGMGEIEEIENIIINDMVYEDCYGDKERAFYTGTGTQTAPTGVDEILDVSDLDADNCQNFRDIAYAIYKYKTSNQVVGSNPNVLGIIKGRKSQSFTRNDVTECWVYDNDGLGGGSGEKYLEETTDANDADADDVVLQYHGFGVNNMEGDCFYVGCTEPFWKLESYRAAGYVSWLASEDDFSLGLTTYEYWDGSAWTSLPNTQVNTSDDGLYRSLSWTCPDDWVADALEDTTLDNAGDFPGQSSGSDLYWMRLKAPTGGGAWSVAWNTTTDRLYLNYRYQYSRNPADALIDLLLNYWELDSGDLDIITFKELFDYCDATPSGGNYPRYRFDHVCDYRTTINDMIKRICQSFYGMLIVGADGRYKPVWKQAQASAAFNFTEDWNITSDIEYWYPEKSNYTRVQFWDEFEHFRPDHKVFQDDIDMANRGKIMIETSADFIVTPELAERRAWFILTENMATEYGMKFSAPYASAEVELLDRVTVTTNRTEPAMSARDMIVAKRTLTPDFQIEYEVYDYLGDFYGTADTGMDEPPDEGEQHEPDNPYLPLNVDNLALSEETDGFLGVTFVRVTYDAPENTAWYTGVVMACIDNVGTPDGADYICVGQSREGLFDIYPYMLGFVSGDEVWVKVKSVMAPHMVAEDIDDAAGDSITLSGSSIGDVEYE